MTVVMIVAKWYNVDVNSTNSVNSIAAKLV